MTPEALRQIAAHLASQNVRGPAQQAMEALLQLDVESIAIIRDALQREALHTPVIARGAHRLALLWMGADMAHNILTRMTSTTEPRVIDGTTD